MSFSELAAALAAGVTIVTPNKRLARSLVARHDAAMVRAGHRTWTAARALPWHSWLTTLWRDACDAQAVAPALRLLAPVEAAYLWDRLVAAETVRARHCSIRRGGNACRRCVGARPCVGRRRRELACLARHAGRA
jgi:hypothetical protein